MNRFSQTEQMLSEALFSENFIAEAIIAFADNQPISLAIFYVNHRNFGPAHR